MVSIETLRVRCGYLALLAVLFEPHSLLSIVCVLTAAPGVTLFYTLSSLAEVRCVGCCLSVSVTFTL